ncbi:hypothetical protein AAKU55_003057 [Oxalobacteraceae bacterium GrIS 1.11]
MLDAPATPHSGDGYALPIQPASAPASDAPKSLLDLPDAPIDVARRDRLARAARVYADALLVLAPGPDIAADLMREQFAEQVQNPERYHPVDEAENNKGLRIGDAVIRAGYPDRLFMVTSICAREIDGARRVEVHAISHDSYGGWTPLESVQKAAAAQAGPGGQRQSGSYPLRPSRRPTKVTGASRTIDEAKTAKDQINFQERQNRSALAAAVEWGFDPAGLTPNQDGWITPRFEHIDFAVRLTASGAHVEITVAQAPNGNWASATAYSEKLTGHMSRPFPNPGYRQHPSRDAAIQEQLSFLYARISKKLFAQVVQAAGIAFAPDETRRTDTGRTNPTPDELTESVVKGDDTPLPGAAASLPAPIEDACPTPDTPHRPRENERSASNEPMAPHLLEQARALLARYIDESGDLFGAGGIHLLAGPIHAPKRIELLSLLRGGTKIALRDAFYAAAGISGSSDAEKEASFGRWSKRAPAALHAPPHDNEQSAPIVGLDYDLTTPAPAAVGQSTNDAANVPIEQTYISASGQVADWVAWRLRQDQPAAFTVRELFNVADKAFGGTQAAGRYTVKDAYDAMEAGVNRAILDLRLSPDGNAAEAARKLATLDRMLMRFPSQTRRTNEMEEFQQFSTPPTLAFAAAWTANITAADMMVEPSAGTGSIAIFGVLAGAEVVLNELAPRRAAILAALLPQQQLFTEDAEQLHNALPDAIHPTVIVMNPPFSATAGRMRDARPAKIGARHVEQALRRLAPGGRLVAIVGSGMAMDRPNSAQWWDSVKASHTVRADLGIDGKNYVKYGTTFDIRLLVIDKTGPTRHPALTAKVEHVAELLPLLNQIRHDRGDAPTAQAPHAGQSIGVPDQPGSDPGIAISQRQPAKSTEVLSDAIYEHYQPQRLSIAGAAPHPGKLVQSAAMAATEPPIPHYVPDLPRSVIELGQLSLPQLETVVYAGQAHEQRLPDGRRRGFFIGDGTGVGKGRTIAGIILDNLRAGRGKAVWISEKGGLLRDAQRDFAGVGGDPASLFSQGRTKPGEALPARDGILFASYTLLAATQKSASSTATPAPAKARLQQLLAWLGSDFDGVIAFDESHNMANAIARRAARGTTPPSAKALAGIALQEALPNARVVYVSATGATEVSNLAYAARLGLWGEGTPFANVSDFVGAISAGGVAAMELVSRDMKAMGVYLARSLSFDGVTYERLEHALTPLQTDIYNELAGAWQTVLQNVDLALSDTGQGKDGAAKSAALARFWGAHQRFFNQVITSMQMPTVLAQARADIERGHAVVMQLVNTNEAAQERQLAEMAQAGADLDELDFTPRQNLIDYVKTGFPIQQYEQYKDDKGNLRSRPVLDAAGRPLNNKDMEARRDALVQTLNTIRVPDNPIDSILNAFGSDIVAEVTGRSRRFILERNDEGDLKPVEQKRSPATAVADADAFMDDTKRLLVFSDAGGTGYSFHADLTRANQRKRIHYLIQPGWRADKAVQGMGRTHRTNEASQPHYVLPTTNLEAQRRFISSIARRLDQLGALTKGQRQTGSQGLFDASDNLESDYACRALRILFMDMYGGHARLDFGQTTHAMGLNGLIDARTGALNDSKLPTIPQFLNRLLSLKTSEQDRVFGEFFGRMEHLIESAKEQGNYDHGVETIRAQSIRKLRDEIVHTDMRTGAETHYVELALHYPTRLTPIDALPIRARNGDVSDSFLGYFRNEKTNKVFALQRTGQGSNEKGATVTRARHFTPSGPMRHVDNADQVAAAALGKTTIKRREPVPVYGGQPFSETWTRDGRVHTEHSATAAGELEKGGITALERLATMPGIAGERRLALTKVVDRIKGELVSREVEREVRAYTRLTEAAARDAWNAEVAAAPKTHVRQVHLVTGALLPIWDRIPGSPRVIRTQTDDGERLLGRTVAPTLLAQTLKNLGVGSDLAILPPERIVALVLGGAKAVLANGWKIATARVSHETRIEIESAAMSDSERRLLTQQGAFCERIQWRERVFIPTGAQAPAVLARILESKPVAELFEKPQADEASDPVFCRETPRPDNAAAGKRAAGMDLATLKDAASAIQASWPCAPSLVCVQSPVNLPFPALPTTRGAFHRDTIYLVADNIANDRDLQFVIGHEALGHAGLRAILDGESLANEMTRLRRINPCLDRAAREKVIAHGYSLDLATEEALCDLAGKGLQIHGLQPLMLAIQRGLRRAGLGKTADWFESKTQSETLDLLRQAKVAITEHVREFPPASIPSTPGEAIFAHHERDQGTSAEEPPVIGSAPYIPVKRRAPMPKQEETAIARPRLDPFGLRAFGVASLKQIHPAYRDTGDWLAVPAIMDHPEAVAAIRADLARIEDTLGGMLNLDANGNLVIIQWNPRADMQSAMTSITALADRHGLGVLAKRSAFTLTIENASILRSHEFAVVGASVTRAATGRDGPPNYVTFMRKPTGAPLFSHVPGGAQLGASASERRVTNEAVMSGLAMPVDAYRNPTIVDPRVLNIRKTRRPHDR